MLELDLIVGTWARKHLPTLSKPECLHYENEVLQMETPYLLKNITGEVKIPENSVYLHKLREYALSKKDFNE